MTAWYKKNTAKLDERISIITKRFQSVFGDRIQSLILYGSALGEHWNPEHSDINLALEFNGEDTDVLDLAAGSRKEFTEQNVNILWFATGELARASDVFPIELLDLKLRHRVLLGIDPLNDVIIYRPELRMACEHFTREKMLTLRSHYQRSAGEEQALRQVLLRSTPGWSAMFQAVLYLADKPIPEHASDRAEAATEVLQFDDSPFKALFEWRKQPKSGDSSFLMQLYRSYLRAVKSLTLAIDHWENYE